MNDLYSKWSYQPANFHEEIERWVWNCRDGLRHNLEQPASDDPETAKAWAKSEVDAMPDWQDHDPFTYIEKPQPEDWDDFVSDVREALEGEFLDVLQEMRADIELKQIMTAPEVAEAYGIEEITVYKNIERGNLRARKAGKTLLIRRADAEARWGKKK